MRNCTVHKPHKLLSLRTKSVYEAGVTGGIYGGGAVAVVVWCGVVADYSGTDSLIVINYDECGGWAS